MDNDSIQFLPFNAINDFMRDDYRRAIIRSVLTNQASLSESSRKNIARVIKNYVKVPGFRASNQAPTSMLVNPAISAFESKPNMTIIILSAWVDLHLPLRDQVFAVLTSREWEILPVDADRTKLPGFFTAWPEGESFDAINEAFKSAYPEATDPTDDVSLMAVWLSLRLPYSSDDESTEKA